MKKHKLQQLTGISIASGLLTIGSSPSNRHFCQGGRKNLYGKYDRIIKTTCKVIFLLSSLLMLISMSHAQGTTWYTDSDSTNVNNVLNWWSNTDNTGDHPDDFDGPDDVFIIQAGHDYTTTDNWVVANDVTIEGTLTTSFNIRIENDMQVNGSFDTPKRVTVRVYGDVTVGVDGEWQKSGGDSSFTFYGDLIVDGYFRDTGNAYGYGTNNIIGGTADRINLGLLNIVVSDATYLVEVDTLFMFSSLIGDGSLTIGENNAIHVSNTCEIATLDATTNTPNLVSYGGSLDFVMKTTDYHHLNINSNFGQEDENVSFSGTINVNGNLLIKRGGFQIGDNAVLNTTGTTTIETETESRLIFESSSGTANLGHLVMNGGDLGTAQGTVNCSSLTTTGGNHEISQVDLTVNGPTVVDGTLDFTSDLGTKTFEGDVTVNGTWNNTDNATVIMNSNLIVNGTFNSPTGSTTVTGINNAKK